MPSPTEILTSDEWQWTKPEKLPDSISHPQFLEYSPTLSADGLTLLFGSDRLGGHGGFDLWMTKRSSPDAPWSAPTNLGPAINSPFEEIQSTLSSDDRTLIVATMRDERSRDLWISTRQTSDASWSDLAIIPEFDDDVDTRDPCLSADGLTLYYAQAGSNLDLYSCRRESVTDRWSAPVRLDSPINTDDMETDPQLTSDGRTLLFVRRSTDHGAIEVLVSTRASIDTPWSEPTVLRGLGNMATAPTLSADGRTLIYERANDLWMVRRVKSVDSGG